MLAIFVTNYNIFKTMIKKEEGEKAEMPDYRFNIEINPDYF